MKFSYFASLAVVEAISVERITGMRHHNMQSIKKRDELDWIDPVPYVTNTDDHQWASPLSTYSTNWDGD